MWARGIAGLVLCAVGALFVGQGTNAVHGSTMSGHPFWAYVGGVMLALGLAVLALAWRSRRA